MANPYNWNAPNLSPTQQRIADFIEKNRARVPYLNEKEIAAGAQASIASVSRFWSVIGFTNMKEFKENLRLQEEKSPANKLRATLGQVRADDVPGNLIQRAVGYLAETEQHLSREAFGRAVERILRGRVIYIYAPGPAVGLGDLLSFRLNRYGIVIKSIASLGSELFESLVHIQPEDVVVLFCFVTLLREAKVIVDLAATVGYKTIIITDTLVSDVQQASDTILYAARGDAGQFHSMVSPTLLVESLVISVGQVLSEQFVTQLDYLQDLRRAYFHLLPR